MICQGILKTIGYVLYIPLIWGAGNTFCKYCLSHLPSSAEGENISNDKLEVSSHLRGGRLIGLFERVLISIGIVSFQWELILAVIALKTVARYQKLDDQRDAEYFLIGSLSSLLWAVIISLLFVLYDVYLGYDLFTKTGI